MCILQLEISINEEVRMRKTLMSHRTKSIFVIILLFVEIFLVKLYRDNSRAIFYNSAESQLLNFNKLIKRDINQIVFSTNKFLPEIVKNYQTHITSHSERSVKVYNDFIELCTVKKRVRIDTYDIKYLFDNIFEKHYLLKFADFRSHEEDIFIQQEIFEGLYVEYFIDEDYIFAVFKNIDRNLYILFLSINAIFGVIYLVFKRTLFIKISNLEDKNQRLSNLENYKKATHKLSQILRSELEKKLNCALKIDKDIASEEAFALVNKKEEKINLSNFISLVKEYYFNIQFNFYLRGESTITAPISLASFYQLIFSMIDTQSHDLSKDREITIKVNNSGDDLTISLISEVTKYYQNGKDIDKVNFSHPLLVNFIKNQELLSKMGVEFKQFVKNDLRQIDIILNKKSEKASMDNIWELRNFKK